MSLKDLLLFENKQFTSFRYILFTAINYNIVETCILKPIKDTENIYIKGGHYSTKFTFLHVEWGHFYENDN